MSGKEEKETKQQSVMEEFESILKECKKKDPDQQEFLQAVEEVGLSLINVFKNDRKYLDIFKIITEPERAIQFRVPWVDRNGKFQVNRGFRVQFSSTIGPYKGGLRFHPSVNLSIVKFLGFEQTFKNALTTLPMGGAKGGSDFNPKGKTDGEVLSFCKSFMTELYRHIGQFTDIPAGDIGVGAREIGYLYGQYKRIKNVHGTGVLTGKGLNYGGSLIRPEATGYGVVYFAKYILDGLNDSLEGKVCIVSGSGNVALHCCEKLITYGAKVITASDSSGYILEKDGFTKEQIDWLKVLKFKKRGRVKEYLKFSKTAKYFEGKNPFNEKCDIVFPCATQNEINLDSAKSLVKNGATLLVEGANMPTTTPAINFFKSKDRIYVPGKASNAGGVSVSGLEMSQNSERLSWTRKEVDERLQTIIKNIYTNSMKAAKKAGKPLDFQLGANVVGFLKVADSMLSLGHA